MYVAASIDKTPRPRAEQPARGDPATATDGLFDKAPAERGKYQRQEGPEHGFVDIHVSVPPAFRQDESRPVPDTRDRRNHPDRGASKW